MNATELEQVARQVCTPKELEVIYDRFAGRNIDDIADALGISRRAVQYRVRNAERKIKIAIRKRQR